MASLVRHLHDFARDIRLAEDEWMAGIRFPTDAGDIFRAGRPYLDSDAVFGVRTTLIADRVPHDAGEAPDGSMSASPFHPLDYDFVLQPTVA